MTYPSPSYASFWQIKNPLQAPRAGALDGSGAKAECRVTVVVPTALSTQSASTRPYVEWSGSHLLLCGVQRGVRVRLCTLEGRTLRTVVATGAPLRFEFGPMRGLFLLETSDGFRQKIVR